MFKKILGPTIGRPALTDHERRILKCAGYPRRQDVLKLQQDIKRILWKELHKEGTPRPSPDIFWQCPEFDYWEDKAHLVPEQLSLPFGPSWDLLQAFVLHQAPLRQRRQL